MLWKPVMGENPRYLVLHTDKVENYRSASLLACKQTLLLLSSNRKAKARVARGPVTNTWMARAQVSSKEVARGPPVWQESPKAKRRGQETVLCSEDVYNWWGGDGKRWCQLPQGDVCMGGGGGVCWPESLTFSRACLFILPM